MDVWMLVPVAGCSTAPGGLTATELLPGMAEQDLYLAINTPSMTTTATNRTPNTMASAMAGMATFRRTADTSLAPVWSAGSAPRAASRVLAADSCLLNRVRVVARSTQVGLVSSGRATLHASSKAA